MQDFVREIIRVNYMRDEVLQIAYREIRKSRQLNDSCTVYAGYLSCILLNCRGDAGPLYAVIIFDEVLPIPVVINIVYCYSGAHRSRVYIENRSSGMPIESRTEYPELRTWRIIFVFCKIEIKISIKERGDVCGFFFCFLHNLHFYVLANHVFT